MPSRWPAVVAGALLAVIASTVGGCAAREDPVVIAQIRAFTAAPAVAMPEAGPRAARAWTHVRAFYEARGFGPAWLEGRRPTPAFDDLLAALSLADAHGLDPDDYGANHLQAIRRQADEHWLGARIDADRVAVTDVEATYAFVRLASDLMTGRVAPREVNATWSDAHPDRTPADILGQALAAGRVGGTLAELTPEHAQYLGLQQALADERARLAGMRGSAAVSLARRVRQIEMNLDRWRWMPRDLGDRYVLVNVPAYELQVVEADRTVLSMRVVVGAPASPTPVFSDHMTHVVFSPYWNIPESIMREETVPRVAGNPAYLEEAGIEIVRMSGSAADAVDPATVDWSMDLKAQGLRLRQVPGPENALGLVKFLFPNHFNVYLHDTPSTAHFRRARRALSHGCIRVEQPGRLAEYVLADQPAWTAETISAAMRGQDERVARLVTPLPVHLGYWTVWVKPDGSLSFTDDPYQVDRQHRRVLASRSAAPVRRRDQRPVLGL